MRSIKYRLTAGRWLTVVAFVFSLYAVFPDGSQAEEMKSGCEVMSFDASEESQAVLTPAGDYKVTARRQCANVTVRNVSGSSKPIEDFLVSAVFGNGDFAEAKLDPGSDDMKKTILPSETYNSITCFDAASPILILNCEVK